MGLHLAKTYDHPPARGLASAFEAVPRDLLKVRPILSALRQ
jgi:hypothetical protein